MLGSLVHSKPAKIKDMRQRPKKPTKYFSYDACTHVSVRYVYHYTAGVDRTPLGKTAVGLFGTPLALVCNDRDKIACCVLLCPHRYQKTRTYPAAK